MSTAISEPKRAQSAPNATSGRLFFLDLGAGRILSANPDGSDLKTILTEGRRLPDGLVVDVDAGHIYWTNMGNLKANDGSIERADLDGGNITTIVPPGGTFTPKQIQLDKVNGKLYWSDREGMRVMRSNLDGSDVETLVDTSQGDARPGKDATKWCVGIALDVERRKDLLDPERPRQRRPGPHLSRQYRSSEGTDSRPTAPTSKCFLMVLPEPIDLDLDLANRIDVLDGSRRSAARQHCESRAHGCSLRKAEGSGDCVYSPNGRHRPGAGSEKSADVRDRFRRFRLQRESRRIEQEDAAVRPRQLDRYRVRGTSRRLIGRPKDNMNDKKNMTTAARRSRRR